MKAHTTHYALTPVREENQQLHRLLLLLVNTRHWAIQDKEWKTLPVRGHYQQCSFRSIRAPVVLCWWQIVLCTKLWVLPSIMQCINIGGCRCCRVWFHGIHSAPWWKWRNATGYLNIRGSQEHPFIVPVHAPLQTDFLQQAHAHATRSQMPPRTGQRNQLSALTCSVTRSQLSICRMTWYKLQQRPTTEHQRGSSRDSLTQKPEL